MEFRWEEAQEKYRNGYDLYVGQCCVGAVFWGQVLRTDDYPWKITTNLPSFFPKKKEHKTEEDAKRELEEFTTRWFRRAGIKP